MTADQAGRAMSDVDVTVPASSAAVGSPSSRDHSPHWYELATLGCIVILATVGASGLLLAVVGHYTTVAALAIGLPLAAVAIFLLHKGLPRGGTSRAAHVGAALAVLIAVAYAVVVGLTPSQNVVVTRDPGSYMTTAVQLTREGALEFDARSGAFDGVRDIRFAGAAIYDTGVPFPPPGAPASPKEYRDSGIVEPQFNHLASVALAVALDVGGNRLMFRLPALMAALGLMALYAVTVRVTRRPYLSLLAPSLLAVSLPLLNVARNTYSETFTLALLWGAVLVLVGVHAKPRAAVGAVGGVLLGALVCTRVDALLYVSLLFPLGAVSLATAQSPAVRNERLRAWAAVIVSTAAVAAIGWWDLTERSGFYARDLGPQIRLLRLALVASAAVSVVGLLIWWLAPSVRRLAHRVSKPMAVLAALVVAGSLLFGWLVRPYVQTPTSRANSLVGGIQRVLGQPIDPTRTYAEYSLQSMAWYLGVPALAAAIAGLTWAVYRALRGRTDAATLAVLLLCLAAGGLYWYDPQISPDQLWASRRFVPAVFPALALWATAAVAGAASGSLAGRLTPVWRSVAMSLTAVVIIVPPVVTTTPLMWLRAQPGYLQPIMDVCNTVGSDAAIIVVGSGAITLPQSLRSWCDVPAAGEGSALAAELPETAAQIRANGYRLVLVSTDLAALKPYVVPGGPQPTTTTGAASLWEPRKTLDGAPDAFDKGAASTFDLHTLEVTP